MKTFLVYSSKQQKFITTNADIFCLKFVQYGFTWKYALGLIKSKYGIFTAFVILSYIVFSPFVQLNVLSLCLAIFGTSIHFLWLSKISNHKLIATIEAKNATEARKTFINEYLLPQNKIFIKN